MPSRGRFGTLRAVRKPLLCSFILFASLGLYGCGDGNKQGGPPPPVKVKVATLEQQPIAETADLLGSLNSRQSVEMTPQVAGHISAIYVHAGDHVKAGQALLQIDPERERAALASLEAVRSAKESTVRLAQENYDRAAKLAPAGVMTAAELQQTASALAAAKADAAAAESQIRAQEEQLKYYRISAPGDGVVGDIPVKIGDLVGPTTKLLLLNQSSQLEANVQVPLSLAPKLTPRTRLAILGPDDKPLVEVPLSFISPAVDPETQSVLVKAVFPNTENLMFAQFIRARLTFDQKPGLEVPTTAVSRMSGQYFVFVVKPGANGKPSVEQRNVRLGEIVQDSYVVLDGLQAGDQVVTVGTQKVRNGSARCSVGLGPQDAVSESNPFSHS